MEAFFLFIVLLFLKPLSSVAGFSPDTLSSLSSSSAAGALVNITSAFGVASSSSSGPDARHHGLSILSPPFAVRALHELSSVTSTSSLSDNNTALSPRRRFVYNVPEGCEPEHCLVFYSIYGHRPSFLAKFICLILFLLLAIFHIAEGIVFHQWRFSSLIILGCALEAAGYTARLF